MFLASHAVQSLIHNILLCLTSSNKARGVSENNGNILLVHILLCPTSLNKTDRFPKIPEMFHWFSKTAPYVLTTNGNCKRCLVATRVCTMNSTNMYKGQVGRSLA